MSELNTVYRECTADTYLGLLIPISTSSCFDTGIEAEIFIATESIVITCVAEIIGAVLSRKLGRFADGGI